MTLENVIVEESSKKSSKFDTNCNFKLLPKCFLKCCFKLMNCNQAYDVYSFFSTAR